MKYIYLDGQNIIADAKKITKEMEADEKAVFIYTHKTTPLYAYIGMLAEDGKLAEEYQFKLKICYQKEGLDLTCCQTAGGSKLVKKHAASISRLVEPEEHIGGGCPAADLYRVSAYHSGGYA